jgi:hypothetical protein
MLFEASKRVLEAIRDMAEQDAAATGTRKAVHEVTARSKESLKVLCPNCKRPVIREQLIEKGCYLCGYILHNCPKDRDVKE